MSRKLHKDMTVPIAMIKVIHVENGAAIARLVTMNDPIITPTFAPNFVMVGDLIRQK